MKKIIKGKSKLTAEKDSGRYSEIKKKIFKHNTELDKQKISHELSTAKTDDKFYKVDKEGLEEFMPKQKRTSQYWLPEENVYDTILLQKLVRNINSIARFVVGKQIRVDFIEATNKTSGFDAEGLVISLGALLDHRVPFHMRLDITTGIAIHESFRAKYTTPAIDSMLVAAGYTKAKIAKFGFGKTQKIADFSQADKLFKHEFQKSLIGTVEGKRIETLGLEKYSGYVYYLEAMRQYAYWCHINHMAFPNAKPDWNNPDDFYKALVMYISYKNLLPEILPDFKKFAPKDREFEGLCSQVDVILSTEAKTFEDSMTQSKRLLELFPKEQQDKLAEAARGKGGQPHQGKGQPGPAIMEGTPANGKTTKLDSQEKKNVCDVVDDEQDDAQSEEHEIDMSDRMSRTDEYAKVWVEPAPDGIFDQAVYQEASDIAKQISKNLSFLDSRYNRTNQMFEMRNGELDEDAIYGLKFNQDVFWEEEESPGYNLDFGILIDESGSMGGRKIRDAQIAGLALALALKDNQHINLFVYGHTANTNGHPLTMYRYFDPMEKGTQNINTMFSIRARANNADGYAIAHMGDVLAKGKAKQKVLIVASDGYPSASGYGGSLGIKHTAQMVRKLENQGVFVVQIAVDDLNSSQMFQHFIPYDKQALGLNLKKVLIKKLVEISNLV